jgi:hypothetical protein
MFTLDAPSAETLDVLLQAWPDSAALASEPHDSPAVQEAIGLFLSAVYATDFVQPFDWQSEFGRRRTLMNEAGLKRASAGRWRALMIAHIRMDRFCEGHLLDVLRSGYLEQARLRLLKLRDRL